MKKLIVTVVSASLAVVALGRASIQDVIVRQQWPWNGRVNIDYVLTDDANGSYDIDVSLSNGGEPIATGWGTLTGDLYGVRPGVHRIVWDPTVGRAADDKTVYANFRASLSIANADDLYMVIDLKGGASATNYEVTFTNAPPAGGWSQDEYKLDKIVLRRIPACTFMMGCPDAERTFFNVQPSIGGRQLEVYRQVTLTKPYYIGIFPITGGQYYRLESSLGTTTAGENHKYPVYNPTYTVLRGENSYKIGDDGTWPNLGDDSVLGRLNARASVASRLPGYRFDLPTEAQWECACRAGCTQCWPKGPATETYAEIDANLSKVAVYKGNAGYGATVGSFDANAFGLYDMLGSVYERTRDYPDYDNETVSPDPVTDPVINDYGKNFRYPSTFARGGFWNSSAFDCRASYSANAGGPETGRQNDGMVGFRLACIYGGE